MKFVSLSRRLVQSALCIGLISLSSIVSAATVTITIPPTSVMVGMATVGYTAGTDVTNLIYRTVDTSTCDATTIDALLYTTGSSVSNNIVPGGGMYSTTGSIVFNPNISSNGHYVCIAVTDNGTTTYHASSSTINITPMIIIIPPPPPPMPVPGCMNPSATNYNPSATVDNGSCILPVVAATAGPGGGGGGGGGSSVTPMTATTPVVIAPSTLMPSIGTPTTVNRVTFERQKQETQMIATPQFADGTRVAIMRVVGKRHIRSGYAVVKNGQITVSNKRLGTYIIK